MADQTTLSRRGFVRSVASTAGAASLGAPVAAQGPVPQTVAEAAPLSLRNVSRLPGLTPRGAGWLRFLWEKATTRDDWSSAGIPHPWWDRYTSPVVLSYGRFDLSFSAYGLLLMADQTPAWREVYSRIADELARRIGSISAGLGQRNGCYATRRQAFPPHTEELAAVGVRPRVRHRDDASAVPLLIQGRLRIDLIRERVAPRALPPVPSPDGSPP